MKMQKSMTRSIVLILLALLSLFSLFSCADVETTGIWEDATYTSDKEFGDGDTTVYVEVKAEEQSITFTLHTDKTTLGEALKEHALIEGKEGDYGIMIDAVNGMTAKYEDGFWWGFYKSGELMMVGVDFAEIIDGERYELVREKA